MGNILNSKQTFSEQEIYIRDLQAQSLRARQLQREIDNLQRTVADQSVRSERILALVRQYSENVNEARKRQTGEICAKVSKFASKLNTELIPEDQNQNITIRFNTNGQIQEIQNATDLNYRVDEDTLPLNQIPNNQLTYLYLNQRPFASNYSYIGFGVLTDEFSEDLYQIKCDSNDKCECTFHTREKTEYNPIPLLRSATKLG